MVIASSNNILLPNATIIPELIAFFIVLAVISKKVVPPINRAIETRQRNIAESLKVIDEANTRQSAVDEEAQTIIANARAQARTVVDNANRVAEQLQAEGRRRGEEEYNTIVARAQGEIDRSRRQAESSLIEQMAGLVVSTAERVIQAEIDPQRHQVLIDDAIHAVNASAAQEPSGASPSEGV
jgi:F-type H+-transporting ATPase subunit b